MNKEAVIGILCNKTQFKKERLVNISIGDNMIEFNFLTSIIKQIVEKGKSKEFNPASVHAWNWNNVTLGKVADLLSALPWEKPKLRAEIITPRLSGDFNKKQQELVQQYIADMMEVKFEQVDTSKPVKSMLLKVCNYDSKSYETAVCWLETYFHKKIPQDITDNGSIADLIQYIVS